MKGLFVVFWTKLIKLKSKCAVERSVGDPSDIEKVMAHMMFLWVEMASVVLAGGRLAASLSVPE